MLGAVFEKQHDLFAGRNDHYDLMSDASGEGSEDFDDNDDWMRDLELLRSDWLSNDDNGDDFRPNFIRESDEDDSEDKE